MAGEGEPHLNKGRSERHRVAVDALVARSLDSAFGLAVRVFDPFGTSTEWRGRAQSIAIAAIGKVAERRRDEAGSDRSVREVMARVAESSLDELMEHPGSSPPNDGFDLATMMPADFPMADMAPGGKLPHIVLQDAVASARRFDRRVAFMVLAAGQTPSDAATLLGTSTDEVTEALERIAGRLSDIHGHAEVSSP